MAKKHSTDVATTVPGSKLREQLESAVLSLNIADNFTNVAAYALRRQDIDVDSDCASVLEHGWTELSQARDCIQKAIALIDGEEKVSP